MSFIAVEIPVDFTWKKFGQLGIGQTLGVY